MRRVVASVALLLLIAAPVPSTSAQTAAPTTLAASATVAPPTAELAALRAQVETTKQFQESFMSMAQWTLGTAIAVALALGAFAWHTNKSNYERDRESLAREAKSLGAELRAEIQKDIGEEARRLRDDLAAREKAIGEVVAKGVDAKVAGLKGRLDGIEGDLHALQETELEHQAQRWIDQKVPSNALNALAELLEHQVKRDSGDYFLSETLDKIMAIAKDPKVQIAADTFSTVNEAMQKLPKGLRAASEPITTNLKQRLG